jgi:arsenate reductase
MFHEILKKITTFSAENISAERKEILQTLVDYIHSKRENNQTIRLNFICTHNSRRSHLSQIWAQTMAFHFGINHIFCYSGGTESTAMFPKVAEILSNQGFQIQKLSENSNPVYAVKYGETTNREIQRKKLRNSTGNVVGIFTDKIKQILLPTKTSLHNPYFHTPRFSILFNLQQR